MNAAVTVARLATAAYLRQLHAEGAEPEILMNRAVSHADWMTTSSAKAGDLQLADAYAGVTAWLSASRERMYTRRGPAVLAPLTPAPDHGPLAATLSDRTLAKVLSRPAHVPLSEMKSTRVFGFNVVTISPQGITGGPRLDGVVSRQRAQDELDELEPFMVDGWKTVMVELREVVS